MTPERRRAQASHPAAHWSADLSLARRRMIERLRHEQHPWPEMAATLLAARGRMGLDRDEFAQSLGIEIAVIAGLEDGTASADDVARWTSEPADFGQPAEEPT